MNSFEEFMDEVEKSPTKALPESDITLPAIQSGLTTIIGGLSALFLTADNEQQKFSEKVSNLVQDKAFLSEFSGQIGEPLDGESEDEFVKRSSDRLMQMLCNKFDIRF